MNLSKKISKYLLAIFICFCFTPSTSYNVYALGSSVVIGSAAIGVVINQLMDRASQLLTQAEGAGLVLEAQAASQAILILKNAQQSYADSLTLTISSLSAQQQQIFSGAEGLLDDVEKRTITSLDKAKEIANIIPFSNRFPQVIKLNDTYLYDSSPDEISFEVEGNFFDVARYKNKPSIKIKGNSEEIKSSQNTTKKLTFLLPKNKVLNKTDQKTSYKKGTLLVPYKDKCGLIFKLFKCEKIASFDILFISLPSNPGKIKLYTTSKISYRESGSAKSRDFIQDSAQNDKEETHCEQIQAGWTLDTNSVAYHFTREEGSKDKDWFDGGNKSSANTACWRFKTLHKGFGTSGKLTFYLDYKIYRDVIKEETTEKESVNLNWGQDKVLQYDPSATWKLVFTQFDGKEFEYSSSDSSNPYITIKTAGNTISIKVK